MEGKKQGSEALKKMIPQLLISVSLFSFLLSYSSLLYNSSPSPNFHHYFSFQLLNKNSLFLICNGLLVFLAKTSGFIQPPTAHDLLHKGISDTLQALDEYGLEEDSDGGKIAAADGGPKEVSISIAESEEEEGEVAAPNSPHVDEDDDHGTPTTCWLFDDDGEHLYGQEGDGDGEEDGGEDGDKEEEEQQEMMNTEELNRKFEDFIKKMKEEIIVNEARQKVVKLN